MFEKKIAFVISSQHFIAHGGIGQFAKTYCDMAKELGWAVHIILDKAPTKTALLDYINSLDNTHIYYNSKVSYGDHNGTFVFSDGMNLQKMVNFESSMMTALENNLYDCIIINSPDAVTPIYNLDLQDRIPVVFYTHSENFIFLEKGANAVFHDSCINYMQNLLNLPNLTIGTQTHVNVHHIEQNFGKDVSVRTHALPMRIPEIKLLDEYHGEKSGVMFIGRWEPRKNPFVFCDAVIEADLPAKILTNDKGAEKFKKYFESKNFDNYEIKAGIMGQEKVDFIKSAKVGFHPAKLESFGFSAFETLHSCPTLCLTEYGWYKNFDGLVQHCKTPQAAATLKQLYAEEESQYDRLEALHKWDDETVKAWLDFMDRFYPAKEGNPIEIQETVSVSDVYTGIWKRKKVAIDDVKSLDKKADLSYHITHELKETYITPNDMEYVKPSVGLEGLFDA